MPGPAITPRLIHPQPVVIEQLDKAGTTWDDVLREPETSDWPVVDSGGPAVDPAAPAYAAPLNLQAQISYKQAKEVEHTKDGDAPRGEGHLLFQAAALDTAGVTLQVGDRCIAVGPQQVEYYFVDIVPMGHYEKPHFIKAVFVRRKSGIAGVRSGGLR